MKPAFIDKISFPLAVLFYLAALAGFAYWDYDSAKQRIMTGIDKELYSLAMTLKHTLPEDYHDRATDKDAISLAEDLSVSAKLTRLVRDTDLKYAYTIIKEQERLFFVASDTEARPQTERGTFYFVAYDEADKVFFQAFDVDGPSYKNVTDQWGTVRTVMVPERSPGGRVYLACADYDISFVNGQLQKNMFRSLAIIFTFLVLGLPIIISFVRQRIRYTLSLEESETKYRNLVESTQDIVWSIDNDGVLTYVNNSVKHILGYDADELIGLSSFHMMDPEDALHWKDQLKVCVSDKQGWQNVTIQWQAKNGEKRFFESSALPVFDTSGNVIGFQGLDRDVTERVHAEQALREKENQYRILVENQTDLVVKVDLEGRFVFVSPSYCRMFGKTEAQLIGNQFMPLVHEEDRDVTKEAMETLFSPPYTAYMEQRALTRDGWKWLGWLDTAILDEDGHVTEIIGVGRDITDSKEAEEEKLKAQRMAAEHESYAFVGKISGALAHDFNNILGVIMGRADLALIDCQDPELKNTLTIIKDQTLRGRNLTKNLVAFAKDTEPRQTYFKISEKISLILDLMKKDLDTISVVQESGPNIPEFLGDPGMLEHAFMNMIQNSIHAVSKIDDPKIVIKYYLCENDLCLEIEDNGCGIPEKHLDDIFDPTFSLKGSNDLTDSYDSEVKGTGYGLANVKKYIDLHKGSIRIESSVGGGTKILIRLPMIKKELSSEEVDAIREETVKRNKMILLVEDEVAISQIQYRILTSSPCDHTVDAALSGAAAIDLFERNQYDLISLDYQLPGQINGMDVYEHIRSTDRNVLILFVSGNLEFIESIKKLKEEDPFVDHISKPCQNKEYIDAVNRLLNR